VRRAFVVLVQIVAVAIGIAAIGGLIGFLIVHFDHWGGASKGFSLGMIAGGVLVLVVAGSSGSPGQIARDWGESPDAYLHTPSLSAGDFVPAQAPRNWLQIALGGAGAIAAGIGVIALFGF
jgi:hypothetical protein